MSEIVRCENCGWPYHEDECRLPPEMSAGLYDACQEFALAANTFLHSIGKEGHALGKATAKLGAAHLDASDWHLQQLEDDDNS